MKILYYENTCNNGSVIVRYLRDLGYDAHLAVTAKDLYSANHAKLESDLIEVSARFVDSNEFRTLYGTNPTNEQFLTKVYQNVLGRDPEPDGDNWWLNEIRTNPDKTRAKVLADFSESLENKAGTAQLVGQGIVYEPWVG